MERTKHHNVKLTAFPSCCYPSLYHACFYYFLFTKACNMIHQPCVRVTLLYRLLRPVFVKVNKALDKAAGIIRIAIVIALIIIWILYLLIIVYH